MFIIKTLREIKKNSYLQASYTDCCRENTLTAERQQAGTEGNYPVGTPLLPCEDCTRGTPFGSAMGNFSSWMGRGKLKWKMLYLSSMQITEFLMPARCNSGRSCRCLPKLLRSSCTVVCLFPWLSLLKCSRATCQYRKTENLSLVEIQKMRKRSRAGFTYKGSF